MPGTLGPPAAGGGEVVPAPGGAEAGEVISAKEFYSKDIYSEFKSLDEYIARLHKLAIENWVEFVKKQVILNNTSYAY